VLASLAVVPANRDLRASEVLSLRIATTSIGSPREIKAGTEVSGLLGEGAAAAETSTTPPHLFRTLGRPGTTPRALSFLARLAPPISRAPGRLSSHTRRRPVISGHWKYVGSVDHRPPPHQRTPCASGWRARRTRGAASIHGFPSCHHTSHWDCDAARVCHGPNQTDTHAGCGGDAGTKGLRLGVAEVGRETDLGFYLERAK
jgi:hypothetical protein